MTRAELSRENADRLAARRLCAEAVNYADGMLAARAANKENGND